MNTGRKILFAMGGLIIVVIVAFILLVGQPVPREVSLSRDQVKTLMIKEGRGDGQASFCLSLYHLYDDEKQSRYFLERAAAYGQPDAQYRMYWILKSHSPEKAIALLKESANDGNPKSLRELGDLYREGQGVPRSAKEAERCYRKAAEKGHLHAMYELSKILVLDNAGQKKTLVEAYKWLLIASLRADPNSVFGKDIYKQEQILKNEITRWKYRVEPIREKANSDTSDANQRIPHSPIAPDYTQMCQDLANES